MTIAKNLPCLAVMLAVLAPAGAFATGISDNFESYALGTFPSASWLDVATVDPQIPIAPIPSGSIVSVLDAFGHPTQAFSPTSVLSSSKGIYQNVAAGEFYSLHADMRVDQYADHPALSTSDWAMQLTFAKKQSNFEGTPQAGVYASSLTHGWRLFVVSKSMFADIDLGVAAALGTWYTVSTDMDAATGRFHIVISDTKTGIALTNQTDLVSGWVPAEANFDTVAFFGGELSPADTIGNVAFVDNVNVVSTVPEPGGWTWLGGAALLLGSLRRYRPMARAA